MHELKAIVQSYDQAIRSGSKCALATIVHVHGSSYRKPGARMLITENGDLTGAISGGCLEGDALKKALHVMYQNKPMVQTYDTMDDDDAILGVGLGCNGIIKVLIEPIDPTDDVSNPIEMIRYLIQDRECGCIVTLFNTNFESSIHIGTKFAAKANHHDGRGRKDFLSDQSCVDSFINKSISNKESQWHDFEQVSCKMCAFFQFVPPSIQLLVAGAGIDVVPLAEMAHILGWDTIIVDGRPNYINKNPYSASCAIQLAKPEEVLSKIQLDEYTYAALMTHNYNYDKKLLSILLAYDVLPYIGMLGSKTKIIRMLDEFNEEGLHISEEKMRIIHSPIGLDIGAENAGEIAASIIGEIQAIYAKKERNTML
jgi:xanthine/CO dehydrogenase XdhC/CoxF family maturation factor